MASLKSQYLQYGPLQIRLANHLRVHCCQIPRLVPGCSQLSARAKSYCTPSNYLEYSDFCLICCNSPDQFILSCTMMCNLQFSPVLIQFLVVVAFWFNFSVHDYLANLSQNSTKLNQNRTLLNNILQIWQIAAKQSETTYTPWDWCFVRNYRLDSTRHCPALVKLIRQ